MSECIAFSAWMPHALLAVLALGVGLGSFIRLGLDRAELAAYRRIARKEVVTEENVEAHARAVARGWRRRAEVQRSQGEAL